jgi:hypothetical protein
MKWIETISILKRYSMFNYGVNYKKHGKNLPESFWFTLEEITGASPPETQKVELMPPVTPDDINNKVSILKKE